MIIDTSALIALYNPDEHEHSAVSELIIDSNEQMIVSPLVLAELDYMIQTKFSPELAIQVMLDVAGGAFTIAHLDVADIKKAARISEKYLDTPIGLTDASLVVLAEHFEDDIILTTDFRHFSVLRNSKGKPFTLPLCNK